MKDNSKFIKHIDKNFNKEKNSFEKFQDKFKLSIFGVLFVLLKEEGGFSFFVDTAFLVCDLLQFFYFPFGSKVKFRLKFNS